MKELDRHEAFELASPYPYTLAVILDKRERPNIIGISWWTFTSWKPLMLAVSIGKQRYSHECLHHSKEFVLCFPAEGQEKDAWLCGTKSGKNMDKFQATEFRAVPSLKVHPPSIEGVTVSFECKVVEQVETGDHTLFIADVVAKRGNPDKVSHLYSIHYRNLISISSKGDIKLDLEKR